MTETVYYTPQEAVNYLAKFNLNFPVRTMRWWIQTGKINAVNLGGKNGGARWYVSSIELDRFIREGTKK